MSIFNNVSYKLSRGQAVTLNILGTGFIGLSVVWLVLELAGV